MIVGFRHKPIYSITFPPEAEASGEVPGLGVRAILPMGVAYAIDSRSFPTHLPPELTFIL
ncbi:MAG TPA: hypothetical protein IGS17_08575 [Oscillatoriales cyanobacterium M59_W2019_021]|nr:hypothetical protein [Oscillatoriales cyanobacterium M4454_W2019_049]HIK50963.1 hypothetical protein [Oscillatoriales cyanobacterium M59_W2019_021]